VIVENIGGYRPGVGPTDASRKPPLRLLAKKRKTNSEIIPERRSDRREGNTKREPHKKRKKKKKPGVRDLIRGRTQEGGDFIGRKKRQVE